MGNRKPRCKIQQYQVVVLFYLFLIYTCAVAHMWMSEDTSRSSVLFFCQVSPGDSTQVFRLGDECLHLLSCLPNPVALFIFNLLLF